MIMSLTKSLENGLVESSFRGEIGSVARAESFLKEDCERMKVNFLFFGEMSHRFGVGWLSDCL